MTKLCGFTIATATVLTRAPPFRPTKLARLGCRPANGRAGGSSIAAATELSSIALPHHPQEDWRGTMLKKVIVMHARHRRVEGCDAA